MSLGLGDVHLPEYRQAAVQVCLGWSCLAFYALGTWSPLVFLLYPCLQLTLKYYLWPRSTLQVQPRSFSCCQIYMWGLLSDSRGGAGGASESSSKARWKSEAFSQPFPSSLNGSPPTPPRPYQAGCGVWFQAPVENTLRHPCLFRYHPCRQIGLAQVRGRTRASSYIMNFVRC